ncbi:AAC(3) family N-acetyltransferase [Actinoplanes sp. NPDC048796]|uniref:aminoglycoside N(3)-acetyltransferase n=1 Tax=Actinoplanes sp. NPDC048796 TaxID=3155640 RepID=UPI0033F6A3AE
MIAPGTPLRTRESLTREFMSLGVRAGDVLLVHSSLRAIGWVCGGATAVVQALLDAVGPGGTVVVPAQTPGHRDPARWSHEAVPSEWWDTIRDHLPAFEPLLTPSATMGVIAERVRTWPGACRSGHPLTSFAAVGSAAEELMAGHELESMLGDGSPLGALERAGAKALLLGVGYEKCTAFHLAESRREHPSVVELTAVMRTGNGREWVRYETIGLDDHDFGDLGVAYEAAYHKNDSLRRGMVGAATSRLFPIREAVRFAESWLTDRRPVFPNPRPGTGDESEKR